MPRNIAYPPDDDSPSGPSRTQRKKAAHAKEDMASVLLDLPDAQLDTIDMEPELRDALRETRRLRSFEARRRHLQFVGKLLRVADQAPLQRAVELHDRLQKRSALAPREAEQWLERLLGDDEALTEWITHHPQTDLQAFKTQVRNARREWTAALAADPTLIPARNKGRYRRELFGTLREMLGKVSPAE